MTSKMWWWILKVRQSLLVFSLIGTIHLFTPSFIFRASICGTHGTVSAYSQALAPVPPQTKSCQIAIIHKLFPHFFLTGVHLWSDAAAANTWRPLPRLSRILEAVSSRFAEILHHNGVACFPPLWALPPSWDFSLARAWEYLLFSPGPDWSSR